MSNNVKVNDPYSVACIGDLPQGTLFRYMESACDNVYMKCAEHRLVLLRTGELYSLNAPARVIVVKSVTISVV